LHVFVIEGKHNMMSGRNKLKKTLITILICGLVQGMSSAAFVYGETEADAQGAADSGIANGGLRTSAEAEAATAERETSSAELGYVPGELIVSYRDDTGEKQMEEVAGELDGEVKQVVSEDLGIATVSISDETTVETAIAEYENDPAVEYAEPNYLLRAYEAGWSTNDPYGSSQSYLGTIEAQEAWNVIDIAGDSEPVKVAILDTGAELSHPDLKNVINTDLSFEVLNPVRAGGSYSAGPLKGDGYLDGITGSVRSGHGTHVTGILAAEANNSAGILGVASGGSTSQSNAIVDLVVIDTFNEIAYDEEYDEDYESARLDALIWAMGEAYNEGCVVMNLSLGTNGTDVIADINSLRAMCDDLESKGVTIVCAAGNENQNSNDGTPVSQSYPSDYDSTISVISVTASGSRASFSNYGDKKDLSAPGSSIYSTKINGTYGNMNGTSMSTPMVSAVAAEMIYVNPGLTPEQIRGILCDTATDLGPEGKDMYTGYGCVNAHRAVAEAADLTDISDYTIELEYETVAYTGYPNRPSVTVTGPGGNVLTKGTDYTVTYSNYSAVGTATVTVNGKGSYFGTLTATFKIVLGDPGIKKLTNVATGTEVTWNQVTGATHYYIYRKKSSETSWTRLAVVSGNSTTAYTDKTTANPYKYTYLVRAYNNGRLSPQTAGKVIYKVGAPAMTRNVNSAAGLINIKYTPVKYCSGYQIVCATNNKFTKDKVTISTSNPNTTDRSFRGLTKGRTYYVRARAYRDINGTRYYSNWGTTKAVKVTK
jgi:subtilisin family serine protease